MAGLLAASASSETHRSGFDQALIDASFLIDPRLRRHSLDLTEATDAATALLRAPRFVMIPRLCTTPGSCAQTTNSTDS